MAVPGGGTNGANGFATVDEDAAVIDVGLIVPVLPLPCGNGSNFWSDDTITLVVSKDVDAIVVVDIACCLIGQQRVTQMLNNLR